MNAQRLSKIIQTRDSTRVQNHLLDMYSHLDYKQREHIRQMLRKYKTDNNL